MATPTPRGPVAGPEGSPSSRGSAPGPVLEGRTAARSAGDPTERLGASVSGEQPAEGAASRSKGWAVNRVWDPRSPRRLLPTASLTRTGHRRRLRCRDCEKWNEPRDLHEVFPEKTGGGPG